jgi:hypothetical protein
MHLAIQRLPNVGETGLLRDHRANQIAVPSLLRKRLHYYTSRQAQSERLALQQRLDDFQRQLSEEKRSHEGTRALLATALADTRKPAGARRKAVKTIKESADDSRASR